MTVSDFLFCFVLLFCIDSGAKDSDGEFSSKEANSDGNKNSTGSIKQKKHATKVRWKENEIGKKLLSAWYHNGPTILLLLHIGKNKNVILKQIRVKREVKMKQFTATTRVTQNT